MSGTTMETPVSNPCLPADYHTHTVLCKHASGTPAECVAHAAARGLAELAFTDHAPDPSGYDAGSRMDPDEFAEYVAMLAPSRSAAPLPVLFGIEADYYAGCEAYLRPWLQARPFDVVVGSVHFIGDWGFDNPAHRRVWEQVDLPQTWRAYFSLIARMAQTGMFDIAAHLDLPKKFGHRLPDALLLELGTPALDAIARAGMALEINTGGLRKPVQEIYPAPALLAAAHARGIPICFGSDAHQPSEVGAAFEAAVQLARAAGYRDYRRYRRRTPLSVPLPPS